MAKLLRSELENVRGEEVEALLKERRFRLSTSPFGAKPGKVVVAIGRAAPWKRKGKVPRKLGQL